MADEHDDGTYLGIDLSTQQMKCVILDANATVIHRECVKFDDFGTENGVLIGGDDGRTATSPVRMWLRSLDRLMSRLVDSRRDLLVRLRAVSGGAQQHGTVYWRRGNSLRTLNADASLEDQLKNAFTIENSPIWMDSSTQAECEALERLVGGDQRLCELSGSRAHHRFSAAQIMKIVDRHPQAWNDTDRVSLISSFVASLLIGDYAPIDYTDGSGTNLMDVRANVWLKELVDSISPDLERKLGPLADPTIPLGTVGDYFQQRYGIPRECLVLPFVGDNPASLAGLCLQPTDIGVSLGTSDTVFFATRSFRPCVDAHVFAHFDTNAHAFMPLVCFKNGSLTRERARHLANSSSWREFDAILDATPPGNSGRVGLFFDGDEIAPRVSRGDYFIDEARPTTVAELCRTVLESQCYLKRFYTSLMMSDDVERVVVTGGASVNVALLQMLADVFNCNVYTIDVEDSAALGAAMRARYATSNSSVAFNTFYSSRSRSHMKHSASPNAVNHAKHAATFETFKTLLQQISFN
ncbi:unnamed protein product [Caenorhabditis bovis]|uniref:Xylulose kinase n=1 Tax=Caenorhabditis bovis TaxID=2654633 RepID=A0A8S1ETT6_9PELO|nr:unnamed protein product [Caenorhabditis bovis]